MSRPDRHRPLEGTRLRPAAGRRGRARRTRARRLRRPTDSVAVITLNRPHADNAITTEMGARLTEILETIAVRPAVRVAIITGAGAAGVLGRQRPAPAQEHDQGGLAAPAPGLRPHALHAAAAAQADLRRRQRDRLRRRLRDRPEHRLHHRLRERHLRPARGDDRPLRRRRLAGVPPAPAAAGEGAADADDRRPDHRAGGPPARAWSTSSTRRPS